jgi:hypothetical protein
MGGFVQNIEFIGGESFAMGPNFETVVVTHDPWVQSPRLPDPAQDGIMFSGNAPNILNGFSAPSEIETVVVTGHKLPNPVNGDTTGGRWQVYGGNTLNIYVSNTSNILGLRGWEGYYEVYALDKSGNIIPNICSGACSHYIGSHMLPLSSHTFAIQTAISSPSGYYMWDVNLAETTNITADNQLDFQFDVSVAGGP